MFNRIKDLLFENFHHLPGIVVLNVLPREDVLDHVNKVLFKY